MPNAHCEVGADAAIAAADTHAVIEDTGSPAPRSQTEVEAALYSVAPIVGLLSMVPHEAAPLGGQDEVESGRLPSMFSPDIH